MRFLITIFAILCALSIPPSDALAQGCSDAGMCTLNGMQGTSSEFDQAYLNQFSIGLGYGRGANELNVFNQSLTYTRTITDGLLLGSKLTFASINGDLGDNNGLGDLYIDARLQMHSQLSFMVALKLPLDKADATEMLLPLPMDYQTSLGTTDLILGIGITHRKWHLNLGWQQPLSGANDNGFDPVYYLDPAAGNYLPTNQFRRQGDLLARAVYNMEILQGRASLAPGILIIQHLGMDSYKQPFGGETDIEGSDQLTINLSLAASIPVSSRTALKAQLGFPVKAREARPDGLTREVALILELQTSF
ncbi:hypothetical protein ACFLQV_02545 [Calditrichota bacterium]